MAGSSMLELALFALASLGIVLSTRIVLRMMRSRVAVARRSHRI